MMSQSPLELIVAEGPQRGARLLLQAGSDVKIGSAFDNDVVLRDPAIPAHAAQVRVTSESCQWQAMDAMLDGEVSGSPLALNESVNVANGTSVRLGDTVLLVSSERDTEDTSTASAQASQKAETQAKSTPRRRSSRVFFFILPVFALTGFAAASWWQHGSSQEVVSRPGITTLLAASPFHEIEANTSGDTALITGFVDTQREKLELVELLKASDQPVRLDIAVGEKLASAVEDVYRTNGVDADVVATGAAAVEVRTSVADARQLRVLEKAVRADVPQVSSVKLINVPPKPDDDSSIAPPSKLPIDPGKRVAMVVSTDPSYLLTEDGSRYFVGSLLPSGQRISSIDNGRVLLEQDGQTTELEF